MIEIKDVVTTILQAFKDTPAPNNEDIIVKQGIDYPEYNDITNYVSGKNWNDLTLKDLHYIEGGLYYFTPKAFVYYLPAFLLKTLEIFTTGDMITETTLFVLSPRDSGNDDFFNSRIEQMTHVQKTAVKQFHQYLHEKYPDEFILESEEKAFAFWLNI